MRKIKLVLTALFILSVLFVFVTCDETPSGTLHEINKSLFAEEFWGEWIRMDTGENWYFASNYRKVGDNYTADPVDIKKQSANVIKVTEGTGSSKKEYYLYASRIRNSTFEAVAVSDESVRSLISGRFGFSGIDAAITAANNNMDKQTVEIGADGVINAERIIAGDNYKVTIEGYEFIVTSNTDGDNVGTLTLTNGVNIKTSIVAKSSDTDLMRLYSGTEYSLIIKFTNVGEDICKAMTYQLTLPDELIITENLNSPTFKTKGDLESIMPGKTREVEIKIKGTITDVDYKLLKVQINTEDYYGKTWDDSVSLRVNREKAVFNISSNKEINGVIIVPGGKSYYFRTSYTGSNLYSKKIEVPKYKKDYLVVFSGASADEEAKYSFAVDHNPNTNFNEYTLTDLRRYNDTEEKATPINSTDSSTMGYLLMNLANFYKVSFN